ncbi:MAG: queuosine precursor transporter [Saprospiraceae bacterium]|nr:queuosine precursor transporter [Saprospiraceae bacterium]
MKNISKSKESVLFILLAGFFITNALIAEFIGVKIFSLEKSLGFESFDINIFGIEHLSFNLTAGVLLWPFVFILTDIINEYYGPKGVSFLSYLACVLILYSFLMVFLGIRLIPADFWPTSHLISHPNSLVTNLDEAYKLVYGQGLWIIIGSLTAFLLGQVLDVFVFHKIKKHTGERKIWLRATGSTLVSQLLDSFVVLFIAFYVGAGWTFKMVLAIGFVNYIYKFVIAILITPLLYLIHEIIERYLGSSLSSEMKNSAMQN